MTDPFWAIDNASNATGHALRQLGVVVAGKAAPAPNMTGYVCSGGGSLMIIPMIVTGMTEACLLIATALVCRIAFRFGNKPVRRPLRLIHSWRLALAWLFNFAFFAVGLWYMSAIALCYGREATEAMLIGWLTSTSISWFIMEPGFIVMIVVLPCLCKNAAIEKCNTCLNDIGCDMSIVLG